MARYIVESDFEYKGYRCVVVLQGAGHRCAYVGVPMGHPFYGKTYDDTYDLDDIIHVHWGFTYGKGEQEYPVFTNYCTWWLGWDYGHCYDLNDYDAVIEKIPEYREQAQYMKMVDKMVGLEPDEESHLYTVEEIEEEIRNCVDQIISYLEKKR